jgi:hypothetical protein
MKNILSSLKHASAWVAFPLGCAAIALAASVVRAQTTDEQPRVGALTRSGPAEATRHNAWSRPGTAIATYKGWSSIRLIDINSDGFDDLCGVYGPLPITGGSRYGCVLNTAQATIADPDARVFAGNLIVASAFNGGVNASIHSTIGAIDMQIGIDATGKPIIRRHLCGRTAQGIRCHRFEGGVFKPATLMQAAFSDANGWSQRKYFSSISFVRIRGLPTVCARGTGGILCFQKFNNSSTFSATPTFTEPSFSDANGWGAPEHFETLRFVDITSDASADVCGRGSAGIVCSHYHNGWTNFTPATLRTTQYSNAHGWNQEKYFKTIRFADINGNGFPEVCGRGSGGLICEWGTGVNFVQAGGVNQASFADALGWDQAPGFESISLLRVDDGYRFDACGLKRDVSSADINWQCALSMSSPIAPLNSGAQFEPQLTTRTGDVRTDGDLPVAGQIHSGGRTGICWTSGGEVRCSNRWIW